MKATGIVRRVDDLGRIVIPKEIRRTLRIREGPAAENIDSERKILMGNESVAKTNWSALNCILTVSYGIPFIFLNEYVTIYAKDVIRMFNFREVEGRTLIISWHWKKENLRVG